MKRRKFHRPVRVEALEARLNLAYVVDLAIDEDDGNYATGDLSLREAVRLVNENPAEDTITFAPAVSTISLTNGTLNLTTSSPTTIDGGSGVVVERDTNATNFGIFNVASNAHVTLRGLTIRNGNAMHGGGIFNEGTLTVTNCTVTQNRATNPNGVASHGGGIANLGNLEIFGSAVSLNGVDSWNSLDGAGNSGGGIFNSGTLTVCRSSLSKNGSYQGVGGGIDNSGIVTIINSTLNDNQVVDGLGGGIRNSGRATLINATIVSNYSEESDNLESTPVGGAGIWTNDESSSFTLAYNTLISSNFIMRFASTGSPRIYNSNLEGKNVDPTSSYNLVSYNLVSDPSTAGGLVDGNNGNVVIGDHYVFEETTSNGVVYMVPQADSRAFNGGSNENIPVDLATDLRGEGFPRILNGKVDIGAVETFIPSDPYIIDLAVDEWDSNFAAGDLSLSEAIAFANTNPGPDTITFADGLSRVELIDGTYGYLTDPAPTTILGRGVVLELPNGLDFYQSLFTVGGILELNDLTISYKVPVYYPVIHVVGGTFTMNNSIIKGVNNLGGLVGGAIVSQYQSTVNLNNSTITGNSSQYGGGIRSASGTLNITGSTISENSSTVAGGGIYATGTVTVTNSTISNNSSVGSGGGIAFGSGTLTIINSTITNNRADGDNSTSDLGGGIGIFDSPDYPTFTTLKNSIIAGNFIGTGTAPSDLAGTNIESTSTNNIIGDAGTAGGLTNGTDGNIVGVDVATVLNPTLADNGGPTLTHALVPNSPAINAGSNANVPNDVTTDQRGPGFVRILSGTVDIGALEQSFGPTEFSLIPNLTTPSSNQTILIAVNLTGSPTPTGTVTLYINNVAGTPASLSGGQVQVTVNGLPVGLHTIFARYSGDANYAAADSAVLNQQVYSPSDLNRTGAVDITDVLIEVFYFNTYANQLPIAVANLPAGPPFVDASGDGFFDIKDLLRVVFDYNVALGNPEGEFALPVLSSLRSPAPALSQPPSATDAVLADDIDWLWPELLTTKRRRA